MPFISSWYFYVIFHFHMCYTCAQIHVSNGHVETRNHPLVHFIRLLMLRQGLLMRIWLGWSASDPENQLSLPSQCRDSRYALPRLTLYTWILGLELGSSCIWDKCVTDWAISLAPNSSHGCMDHRRLIWYRFWNYTQLWYHADWVFWYSLLILMRGGMFINTQHTFEHASTWQPIKKWIFLIYPKRQTKHSHNGREKFQHKSYGQCYRSLAVVFSLLL